MTLPDAFDPDVMRNLAIGALALIALLAVIVGWIVQKIVLKIVFLGALVGLGAYVWAQRSDLDECRVQCACHFAGFEVQVPDDACDQLQR